MESNTLNVKVRSLWLGEKDQAFVIMEVPKMCPGKGWLHRALRQGYVKCGISSAGSSAVPKYT